MSPNDACADRKKCNEQQIDQGESHQPAVAMSNKSKGVMVNEPVTCNREEYDKINQEPRQHLSKCRNQVVILRRQFQVQNKKRHGNRKDAVNERGESPKFQKVMVCV